MSTRSRSGVRWHALLIAALTIGLLWLFFASIDVGEAWRAILRADIGLLTAATVITVLTYVLRTWRWQTLLDPLGRATFSGAFRATVIGFAATFLLPGRVGEVLRPYLLARREGFRATATFATVIVERMLDLATVLLLFGIGMLTAGIDVGAEIRMAGLVAALTAVGGVAVLFVLAGHPERLGRLAARLSRVLHGRLAEAAGRLVQTFAEGLTVMRRPAHLLTAVVWSVPLWLSLALGVWLTSRAFDLTFGFTATFLVMGVLTLGVSLPTPGGAGGFHYAYLYAVTFFFGANEDAAGAAAIVLHAVSFVPVTLVGLAFMWQDGLTFGRLRGMRAEAQAAGGGVAPGEERPA